MARETYQDGLKQLKTGVISMADLVLERLNMGLNALTKNDISLAKTVIFGDDEINDMYLELESQCVNLLALQQPVAGDLRLIASSFKIITDLERIADLAVNLGDYTLDGRGDIFPDVDISSLGNIVHTMLADSMKAYENQDSDTCFETSWPACFSIVATIPTPCPMTGKRNSVRCRIKRTFRPMSSLSPNELALLWQACYL